MSSVFFNVRYSHFISVEVHFATFKTSFNTSSLFPELFPHKKFKFSLFFISLTESLPDYIPTTTSSTIETSDKRQIRRSTKTLILDAVLIFDEIICISSVCCDLRFYDLSRAGNLRLYIRNFPSPLNAFHFFECYDDEKNWKGQLNKDSDEGKKSRLIFGDFAGSIRLIEFSKNFRSQLRMGSMMRQISYQELMKVSEFILTILFKENCHAGLQTSEPIVKSIWN